MDNQFYDFDADQEKIKNIRVNKWTHKKVRPEFKREYHRKDPNVSFGNKGYFHEAVYFDPNDPEEIFPEDIKKHYGESDINSVMELDETTDQYHSMLRGFDRYRDAYTAPEVGVIRGPKVPAVSHHQYGQSSRPFWAPPPSDMNNWNAFSPSTERYERELQSVSRPSTLAVNDRMFHRQEGLPLPTDPLNPPPQPFLRFGDNASANYDREPLTQPHPEYGWGFANPEIQISKDSRGQPQSHRLQGTVQDKYPHTERETQYIWPTGPNQEMVRYQHGFRTAYGYDDMFQKYYPEYHNPPYTDSEDSPEEEMPEGY